MDFIKKYGKNNYSQFRRSVLMASLLGLSFSLFASDPTSGLLVVINGTANVINGHGGVSASAVKIVVRDTVGPCKMVTFVAYRGVVPVPWDAKKIHGSSSCINIVSVDVIPLKTITTVMYDSIVNPAPKAYATAATSFIAPTTPITNMVLIVTGGASAAMTNSATSWGSALGVKPVHDANNGALVTTGIVGGVGAVGFQAEKMMRHYSLIPFTTGS